MPTAWTEKQVIHLLNRAGFGATELEIDACLSYGKEETVKRLIEGKPLITQQAPLANIQELIVDGKNLDEDILSDQQVYWLYRMMNTGTPLIEKMALFWHDYFATSVSKVEKMVLMARQIDLFRKYGLGSFRDLLFEVGIDPAMMIWLDAGLNLKGKPNENYAREVMELFTLGRGHYTENDVREAARSFTGWRYDTKNDQVVFDYNQHDYEPKRVLNREGNFDARDIADVLLSQEAFYSFMATKLLQAFVHETPSESWVNRIAAQLKKSLSIREALASIFLSDEFYNEDLRQCIIKSPVEYVISIARSLKLPTSKNLIYIINPMGQELYNPPNVSGWEGNSSWLMSCYLLYRYQFAETAAYLVKSEWFTATGTSNTDKITIEDRIKKWGTQLSIVSISETTLKGLVRYGEQKLIQTEANLRMVLHLLLMSPENQLK